MRVTCEPRREKTNNVVVRLAQTQISMDIAKFDKTLC